MARSVEARRKDLETRLAKCEARAAEYRARVEKHRLKGDAEKADKAAETVKRAEQHAATHRRSIAELLETERHQDRMRRSLAIRAVEQEKKAPPRPDRLAVYREALTHIGELEAEIERYLKKAAAYRRAGDPAKAQRAEQAVAERREWLAGWREAADEELASAREEGRDLVRELAVAVKAEERREGKARKDAKRLEDLKVEGNLGTAAAQREFESRGERGKRGAMLADYATLLRRPQDRTQERLEAMEEFDAIVSAADAGLFPEPRFEHQSGSGHGAGERVMAARAAGLDELTDISAAIGAGTVHLLRLRIVERQSLTAIVRQGIATETTVANLFLAAVDQLRVYLKTRNALAARLAGQKVLPRSDAA